MAAARIVATANALQSSARAVARGSRGGTLGLALVAAGCSLTDFERYAREADAQAGPASDGGPAATDAPGASPDAGPPRTCAESDAKRIFCSGFDGPSASTGWTSAFAKDPGLGEAVTLDSSRAASQPASAKAFVSGGSGRYAGLMVALTPPVRPDVAEVFARVYLEPGLPARVAILSLSGADQRGALVLRCTASRAELWHDNEADYSIVPLRAPLPTGRFFSVMIRRDDAAQRATIQIDGVDALDAPMVLKGSRPPGTALELRAGVIYADQGSATPLAVWVDDVGVRLP